MSSIVRASALLLVVAVLATPVGSQVTTQDGASILIFPSVVVDEGSDTFIQIVNGSLLSRSALCFYVDGRLTSPGLLPGPLNPPLCTREGFRIDLTAQQPTHWVASRGREVDPSEITYLGVATADDVALEPDEIDGEGRPVYRLPTGHGMTLVVEVRPGRNGRPIGTSAFRYHPDDPAVLPDLRLIVSRVLGDGSPEVCDATRPDAGGVPATDPFEFAETQEVSDAINDLGCRADDGQGRPLAHRACMRTPAGTASLLYPSVSQRQFCVPIAKAWGFPAGSTVVAAQVSDAAGTLGTPREMVVLVEGIR